MHDISKEELISVNYSKATCSTGSSISFAHLKFQLSSAHMSATDLSSVMMKLSKRMFFDTDHSSSPMAAWLSQAATEISNYVFAILMKYFNTLCMHPYILYRNVHVLVNLYSATHWFG